MFHFFRVLQLHFSRTKLLAFRKNNSLFLILFKVNIDFRVFTVCSVRTNGKYFKISITYGIEYQHSTFHVYFFFNIAVQYFRRIRHFSLHSSKEHP